MARGGLVPAPVPTLAFRLEVGLALLPLGHAAVAQRLLVLPVSTEC